MTDLLGSGGEFAVRTANRLWAGRYGQRTGLGIGLLTAVVVAGGGYILGPVIHPFLPVYPPFSFRTGELHLLWGVHATVISLSLVGLSFAWNSVRGLPTVKEIIEEITFRLRSIETITFLLASNLCIGIGILFSDGTYVSLDVGYAVGLLLIVSFAVTIRRFWVVFDLLLHNTLDETVSRLAEDAITGRFGEVDDRYESYLAHFFQQAKKDIDQDRPEQLRETLWHVEELLGQVLWEDSPVLDESQILRDAINNYAALHRRSIKQQNEELEQQTISSLHGATLITLRYERRDLIEQSLQAHARLFVQEYSVDPQGRTVEFLLDRFEIAQIQIFRVFERADDRESLESTSLLVDALMRTHATLWKTAIENEDRGALEHLHYLLKDVYQFQPYTYLDAFDRHAADEGDENIEFREAKQGYADAYREEINQLRFVTYGWILHLYREDDVSDRFVNHVFTEYVEKDFGSVSDISGTYFQLVEEAEILNYWERWNMDRELDRSHGVATTGMAANTWLLEFCCTAMVWVIDSDKEVGRLQDLDADRSPLTEYEQIGLRVEMIIDLVESYRSEYPLDEIVGEELPVAERCDALVEYFERVKELLDEQEQENIREMPIFEDAVEKFANAVNSQMYSCSLRTGIQEVEDIVGVDSLDEDNSDGFTLGASMARRLFVDNGIPTTFSSSFSNVLDRYREFVIDHLNLKERELDSIADLPDALAEVAEQDEVVVFVVDLDEAADVLRDDDRSERTPHSEIHSFFDFTGIPVLTDLMTGYVAVALYDGGFKYVEEQIDSHPIGVSVTPGEDVDEWTEADAPEGMVPQDFVKVECSYRARIESQDVNGIAFRVSE